MPILINSNALTFDDILLVPQFSEVASRKDVDVSTELLGVKFDIPIVSANMDTVTGPRMANRMDRLGGLGILHRYAEPSEILEWVKDLSSLQLKAVVPSIGIHEEDFALAMDYIKAGATAICVDIAHGHSQHMVDMVKRLADAGVKVIAGNVATFDGARALAQAGASVIKVGVGPGSMCTTRIVTGHGVPQLTAIEDCVKIKKYFPDVRIIADGGIRNSGDCVKALAFGADAVMVGSLLSGTWETPGDFIQRVNGAGLYEKVKAYRGMASEQARGDFAGTAWDYAPEGEATFVSDKGTVNTVVAKLVNGIRSGMSYSGANNLVDLRTYAEYVIVTNNGVVESRPHGVK